MSDKNKPMFGQSCWGRNVQRGFCCPQRLCSVPQPKLPVGRGSGLIKRRLAFWSNELFLIIFLFFWHLFRLCFWAVLNVMLCFSLSCSAVTSHRFFSALSLTCQRPQTRIRLMLKIQQRPTRRNSQTRTELHAKKMGEEPQLPQSSQWNTAECVSSVLGKHKNLIKLKTKIYAPFKI